MLDTIPHDQVFTRLIITQMITYYDKCVGWYKGTLACLIASLAVLLTMAAMATRARSQAQGGTQLKTAAALAGDGEFREVTTQVWQAEASELSPLLDNVCPRLRRPEHERMLIA